ncbi:MAG: hypothetical protein HC903_12625 [Methylacidiphilales bacterium]|nr:hypothetical protein [Candidatus Methylacidiphilales bacterium]NJR19036.1 hypothetical protein [Calothrix sp. CSU_2_0]
MPERHAPHVQFPSLYKLQIPEFSKLTDLCDNYSHNENCWDEVVRSQFNPICDRIPH